MLPCTHSWSVSARPVRSLRAALSITQVSSNFTLTHFYIVLVSPDNEMEFHKVKIGTKRLVGALGDTIEELERELS